MSRGSLGDMKLQGFVISKDFLYPCLCEIPVVSQEDIR